MHDRLTRSCPEEVATGRGRGDGSWRAVAEDDREACLDRRVGLVQEVLSHVPLR